VRPRQTLAPTWCPPARRCDDSWRASSMTCRSLWEGPLGGRARPDRRTLHVVPTGSSGPNLRYTFITVGGDRGRGSTCCPVSPRRQEEALMSDASWLTWMLCACPMLLVFGSLLGLMIQNELLTRRSTWGDRPAPSQPTVNEARGGTPDRPHRGCARARMLSERAAHRGVRPAARTRSAALSRCSHRRPQGFVRCSLARSNGLRN
jgi:hypothetical protein